MCVFLQFILSHFVSIFQIWGSGRSRVLSQTSSNPPGRFPLCPLHFCFTRRLLLYWIPNVDADTDKGWPAKVTQNCFIHIFTCLKHRAWQSPNKQGFGKCKTKSRSFSGSYSAKSLRRSDSSNDTWNVPSWTYVTCFRQGLLALHDIKCGRGHWLGSETVLKLTLHKEGTGASTSFQSWQNCVRISALQVSGCFKPRQSLFSKLWPHGISNIIWQMAQTRCS